MPNVLPTIPNDPPQGIQALLDKVYLWNPDAANNLIIRINELLKEIEEAGGAVASVNGQTGEVVLTAEDIKAMFAGEEETLQTAIDTLKTDQGDLGEQVGTIESKIPETASEANQLATKEDFSACLPLAGGTMTGQLIVDINTDEAVKVIELRQLASAYEPNTRSAWAFGFGSAGQLEVFSAPYFNITSTPSYTKAFMITDAGYILPGLVKHFGSNNAIWEDVFVKKINNGADITVPSKGGTLALVEDIEESVTTKELIVGTEEGTLNIGITAGTATIATNNGLDIVSPTKFDTAPTTDDTTVWADVNATALVTKAQVTTALSTAGGGTSVTIRNWA